MCPLKTIVPPGIEEGGFERKGLECLGWAQAKAGLGVSRKEVVVREWVPGSWGGVPANRPRIGKLPRKT